MVRRCHTEFDICPECQSNLSKYNHSPDCPLIRRIGSRLRFDAELDAGACAFNAFFDILCAYAFALSVKFSDIPAGRRLAPDDGKGRLQPDTCVVGGKRHV